MSNGCICKMFGVLLSLLVIASCNDAPSNKEASIETSNFAQEQPVSAPPLEPPIQTKLPLASKTAGESESILGSVPDAFPWGKPVEDDLPESSSAEDYQQLCDRLLASPNPLEDVELMKDTVAAGSAIISALMPQLSADDTPQLNAMAALAATDMEVVGWSGSASENVLKAQLLVAKDKGFSGHIGRWLMDPELEPIHQSLATCLATLGTSHDAKLLERYYASHEITRHVQPDPPFRIRTPSVNGAGEYASTMRNAGLYADFEDESGVGYRVVPMSGLISDRYLFLLRKSEETRDYAEVWPLVIKDHYFQQGWGGAYGPVPNGKLTAGFVDEHIVITHHMPIMGEKTYGTGENASTHLGIMDTELKTTLFTLDSIKLDSDLDGLTDLAEKLLFTDPRKADTDGDGVIDGLDPCPNVNPANMGKKERGMARALDFYFSTKRNIWLTTEYNSGPPWQARYMLINGCGPVAFCGSESTYSISLSSDQYAQIADLLGSDSSYDIFSARWIELSPEFWEKRHDNLTQNSGQLSSFALSQSMVPENADALIKISFPNYTDCSITGDGVALVEIDGEYYPLEYCSGWLKY